MNTNDNDKEKNYDIFHGGYYISTETAKDGSEAINKAYDKAKKKFSTVFNPDLLKSVEK